MIKLLVVSVSAFGTEDLGFESPPGCKVLGIYTFNWRLKRILGSNLYKKNRNFAFQDDNS
jgi:hypothetical protein